MAGRCEGRMMGGGRPVGRGGVKGPTGRGVGEVASWHVGLFPPVFTTKREYSHVSGLVGLGGFGGLEKPRGRRGARARPPRQARS